MATLNLRPVRTKFVSVLSSENGYVETGTSPTKHEHEPEPEPVTPAGRLFAHPDFNVNIFVVIGLQSPCPVQEFKDGLSSTLLKHKRFSSVMKAGDDGEPLWVPTKVNIDDHLKVVYPSDEDLTSPTVVEDYVAKLMETPNMDPSKPLFEIHLLKASMGGAAENIVFRVHHSLGDGTSLMSLLLACTQKADNSNTLPTIPTYSRKKGKSNVGFWMLLLLATWRFLLVAWYTFLDIIHFIATILWLEDSKTPIKAYPGSEIASKKLAYTTVLLDDIQIVKRAINGTVNDVTFGMLVAGISQYLQHEYDNITLESEKQNVLCNKSSDILISKKTPLIDCLRIRACGLVNTRPSPGLQELRNMMEMGSQARWGNNMGYIFLPLPVCTDDDSVGCLYKSKKIMDQKKLSCAPAFSYRSGALLMNFTGPEYPAKITYRCLCNTTMSYSNVAGPLEKVQLFGHPITHIIPTVSGQPQALCVHVQSYNGKVTIAISATKDIIPEPQKLCNYMANALEDMKHKLTAATVNEHSKKRD